MCLIKKKLSRSEWSRVLERRYVHKLLADTKFIGDAGLIRIDEITAPLVKTYDSTSITIVDKGYYWLQLAPEGKQFWLTVMLNPNGEIVQYYFDITDENVIEEEGDSYFYDMFLDVVLQADGKVRLLDEDELDTALRDGVICQDQYNEAYQTARKLMSELPKRSVELQEYCLHVFSMLKAELIK